MENNNNQEEQVEEVLHNNENSEKGLEKSYWYTLYIYSGKEKKVDAIVTETIKNSKLENIIFQLYTPVKKSSRIVRLKNSVKRVVKPKNLFPGYIFIKMIPKREVFALISNLPNVMGFLGGERPISLTKEEEDNIIQLQKEGEKIINLTVPFIIDDSVKIINGPFTDFIGTVENINAEKQRLKVIVTIFGRSTPVEVDFVDAQAV